MFLNPKLSMFVEFATLERESEREREKENRTCLCVCGHACAHTAQLPKARFDEDRQQTICSRKIREPLVLGHLPTSFSFGVFDGYVPRVFLLPPFLQKIITCFVATRQTVCNFFLQDACVSRPDIFRGAATRYICIGGDRR